MLKKLATIGVSALLSANAMAIGWTCNNTVGGFYKFMAGPGFAGSVNYNGPLGPFQSGSASGSFWNLVPSQRFDFNATGSNGAFFSYSCQSTDGGQGHNYNCFPTGPNAPVTLVNCQGELF